jgi:predicted RNA methylase
MALIFIKTSNEKLEIELDALCRKMNSEWKRRERIHTIAADLRCGRRVTDFRFDQIYPSTIRELSQTHWTPVDVAIRAAKLLVTNQNTRVLDIGSGCGKFCTIGALSSPGQFAGVEQRPYLLQTARETCDELGASATFIQGNMADLDWSLFDSFYLFNPFYENREADIRIDDTIPLSLETFEQYIRVVRAKLRCAKVGTRVVTYHGFGGDVPYGYHLVKREPLGTSVLELWVNRDEEA